MFHVKHYNFIEQIIKNTHANYFPGNNLSLKQKINTNTSIVLKKSK